ncbi:MAG: transposase [Synechococcaceae cyanobacterium SM2_3_1]|nr:transposase [Synechococcaceae cyanobacterium SM2_3_1]
MNYTTNMIESLNRSLQKVLKTKGSCPSDKSVMKLMDLALKEISQKWTMPIQHWQAAMSRFAFARACRRHIKYPGRLPE